MNLLTGDQAPSLVPTTNEATLADAVAHNPPGSAWWAGLAFYNALTRPRMASERALRRMVTPESAQAWDFEAARGMLSGSAPLTRVTHPAPGVAYMRFVPAPSQALTATGLVFLEAKAIMTLQERPDLGGSWRVHVLGIRCPPDQLPPVPAAG